MVMEEVAVGVAVRNDFCSCFLNGYWNRFEKKRGEEEEKKMEKKWEKNALSCPGLFLYFMCDVVFHTRTF